MSQSKKRLVMWLSGFGVLALTGGLISLALVNSTTFKGWAKLHLRPMIQSSPSLEHLKTIALAIRKKTDHSISIAKADIKTETRVAFPGSRAEEAQGIVTWVSPFSDRIPPTEQPTASQIHPNGQSRPIVLTGLKGETLSFQLVMRSKDPVQGLMVRIRPDAGSPGSRCISTHRFLEIYMHLMVHTVSKYGPLKELINPDPLVPFNDPYSPGHTIVPLVSLKSNFDQPVWVDVHFAKRCQAGTYNGALEVFSDGKIIRKTPVTFNILDASLPGKVGLDRWVELYVSRFYHGENIHSDDQFQALYQRYFAVAHKYGFALNDAGDIRPDIRWDSEGRITSSNWDYYDKLYGPMLSGQLTQGEIPNVWCLPIQTYSLGVGMWWGFTILSTPPSPIQKWAGLPDIATQALAKEIVHHWKEKGWPINRGFAYIFDEPMHKLVYYPDTYRLIAKSAQSLHKGSNGKIRVMITDAPYVWYRKQAGHHKRDMIGNVDIWAAHGETYIPNRMSAMQKIGDRIWFYQAGPPFLGQNDLSDTGLGFRMWFWTAWKYHTNGVFYWAGTFWNDNTKAVNPYLHAANGDGIMFYPGHQLHFLGYPDIDGPVPSIRSSQWRRGYEDYKYLSLLKQKGHGEDADQIVNKMVRKALDDGGYIPYWNNPLWWKPGDWTHDPRVWHRVRVKMAKEIAALYAPSH